ncbi:hypothetical protein [Microbacterium hominis]|uniref:ABC transporter permease n=1 Tax=Microbacterium hominis TaxID=162426 RepID=A0A7D4U5Z3_9MICO|nr:hypothetical protein [Microbacterium hominis]QKJ20525.1 hypothetical protein HQM25_14960 [Microbacterium hominis]
MSVPTVATDARLTYGGAVRSEFLKLSTMRGMWWIAITAVVITLVTHLTTSAQAVTEDLPLWTITTISSVLSVSWVIVACFNALQTTGEWSSGQYRVTFATVPRRTLWLAAKATAQGVYAAVVSLLVLVTSAPAVLLRFSADGASIDWSLPHTWQVIIGVPAVFFVTAFLAVGIGALVRSSGVAVTIVIGLLAVLPFAGAFSLFGMEWIGHLISYLPTGAADSIVGAGAFGPTTDDLGVLGGAAVLLAWTAVAFFGAAAAMKNRDA